MKNIKSSMLISLRGILRIRSQRSLAFRLGKCFSAEGIHEFVHTYYAQVMMIDDFVGEVLAKLDAANADDYRKKSEALNRLLDQAGGWANITLVD